jgi:hypothetical protein
LIAVVRTLAGGLLGPDEGQEDKGGQKAEPPPREDPDVPGDRERRNSDAAPPGTRPCPQQHPPWLGALRQPGHGCSMPNVSVPAACGHARLRGGSGRDGTRASGRVAAPGRRRRSKGPLARACVPGARGSLRFDCGAELEPAVERARWLAFGGDVPGDRGRVEFEVNAEVRQVSHWDQSRCVCRCSRR